jgi:hypothetical protein
MPALPDLSKCNRLQARERRRRQSAIIKVRAALVAIPDPMKPKRRIQRLSNHVTFCWRRKKHRERGGFSGRVKGICYENGPEPSPLIGTMDERYRDKIGGSLGIFLRVSGGRLLTSIRCGLFSEAIRARARVMGFWDGRQRAPTSTCRQNRRCWWLLRAKTPTTQQTRFGPMRSRRLFRPREGEMELDVWRLGPRFAVGRRNPMASPAPRLAPQPRGALFGEQAEARVSCAGTAPFLGRF